MYTRLQQQTTPADADPNSSAAADGGVDGDEIPLPTDVALSPPSVHAYENTAAAVSYTHLTLPTIYSV